MRGDERSKGRKRSLRGLKTVGKELSFVGPMVLGNSS